MTRVINFCGGPAAGKTTNALELAAMFKKKRLNVTYVPEVAYDMVLDENYLALDDQLYLLGQQAHRLYRAKNKFDWIITDAPLFLGVHYLEGSNKKFLGAQGVYYWKSTLTDLMLMTFNQYENYTYFVERGDRAFIQAGRIQNEEQSKAIDTSVDLILKDYEIEHKRIFSANEVWTDLANRGILVV